MGSVSSAAFSVSSLLQSLTSTSPQVSSALSSSTVQAALQTAPAGELVDLSTQALQLQESDLIFGDSNAAETGTLPSVLASTLAPSSESASSSANSSASSTASQLTAYQSQLQAQDLQALFGIAATAAPSSLVNTTG